MTTYHVQLHGICDVIVEANSEYEAKDRAISKIPASSLVIEMAECKGELEGEALETAYRYFPEHLAKVELEKFYMVNDPVPGTVYTSPSPDSEDAHGIYKELSARKASGETLDWIEEDFMEQYSYINVAEKVAESLTAQSYKDKMMACFDEDDNFVGLVGQQENGTYKIVKK